MLSLLKNNYLSFYRHLRASSFDRLPFLCPLDESTIINRDGTLMMVVELSGIDYNGMSGEALNRSRSIRSAFLARAFGYVISYYTLRFRQPATLSQATFNNEVTQGVMDTWANSFSDVFVTRHFLAISTKSNVLSFLSNLGLARGKKNKGAKNGDAPILNESVSDTTSIDNGEPPKNHDTSLTRLKEFTNYAVTALSDFDPKILRNGELYAFLASLINARPYDSINFSYDLFENWLLASPIEFTELKTSFRYLSSGKVASFITLKNFPEYAIQRFFDLLIQKNIEMIVTHHVSLKDHEAAVRKTEDKLRMLRNFTRFSSMLIQPTVELLERLQSGEARLCDHSFSLQVISGDLATHQVNLNKITKFMTQNNYIVSVELLNNEPLYFSQFPSLRGSNVRKKVFTTENLVDFISFSASGTGKRRCSFGPEPTARFASVDGNIFNFIFHVSEAMNALGHTLIIGDSGSGKTTLISFLLACATRHKDTRIVSFDQAYGQEISTRMQYGDYVNFAEGKFSINPLLLPDTAHNRAFLVDFLSYLADATDEERTSIESGVSSVFSWHEDSKRLSEIPNLFTQKGQRLYKKLAAWQADGVYKGFFDSGGKSVDFSNPYITFDFTDIISQEKILGLVTSYLTHMFFNTADGTPRIIFVDEIRRYIESDIFASVIQRLLEEFRKLNGVFIAAAQNIDQLWATNVGRRNIGNFGKFILFPANNLNIEAYADGIGLNDSEIRWLSTADIASRQVMIKTKNGSSTIVNVDLSYLGKYIRVFDSSAQNVKRLRELARLYPNDFRHRFLND